MGIGFIVFHSKFHASSTGDQEASVFGRSQPKPASGGLLTAIYWGCPTEPAYEAVRQNQDNLPIPHLLNCRLIPTASFFRKACPTSSATRKKVLKGFSIQYFPIEDFNKTASLEFVNYEIQEPKYDRGRSAFPGGLTYEAPHAHQGAPGCL